MVAVCKKVVESSWFQNFIIAVILAAGILVGLETYPSFIERFGTLAHVLDSIILTIFVLEIVVKMAAEGSKPWRYFGDPWNVFDFLIVAVCFVPGLGEYAVVLRLARLLRVLRLVTAVPRLQLLVGALLKSIPSMFYVSLLLLLLFYLYAVSAVFLFGENDPIHFGSLQISMLSLFRTVTLEDWTDLMYIQMYGCANYGYEGNMALCTASNAMPVVGALFFVSFVLFGTMIILNLFIGVIVNGMDEAEAEAEEMREAKRRVATNTSSPSIEHQLYELSETVDLLNRRIATIRRSLEREKNPK